MDYLEIVRRRRDLEQVGESLPDHAWSVAVTVYQASAWEVRRIRDMWYPPQTKGLFSAHAAYISLTSSPN